MKLSGNVELDVKLNEETLCASKLPKGRICNISGGAKGIKLKLPWNIEGGAKLYQKTLCVSRL